MCVPRKHARKRINKRTHTYIYALYVCVCVHTCIYIPASASAHIKNRERGKINFRSDKHG